MSEAPRVNAAAPPQERFWTAAEIAHIAEVAHEANRAYCRMLGDNSQVLWNRAEQWQRDSAIDGVKFVLRYPSAGDDAAHTNWMNVKISDGWTYGETKDPVAKTHPCLVPFENLPRAQQVKDRLFRAVVVAVASIVDERVETVRVAA